MVYPNRSGWVSVSSASSSSGAFFIICWHFWCSNGRRPQKQTQTERKRKTKPSSHSAISVGARRRRRAKEKTLNLQFNTNSLKNPLSTPQIKKEQQCILRHHVVTLKSAFQLNFSPVAIFPSHSVFIEYPSHSLDTVGWNAVNMGVPQLIVVAAN